MTTMTNVRPTSDNTRSVSWIGLAYLLFITLFILQGYFVLTGIMPQARYIGQMPLTILMAVGAILAFHAAGSKTQNMSLVFARTVAIEIVALGMLLMTTGFNTIISLALIFLLYESYRAQGQRGVVISSAILALGAMIDICRSLWLGLPDVTDGMLVILVVIITSFALNAALRARENQQRVLDKSRALADLERNRVSTLMNNLAQGVLSVDNKGIIRMYNAAALSVLDTNGSLNGSHIDDIFKACDAEGKRLRISTLMKRNKFTEVHDDIYYKYADDTVRLEVSITPIRVGHKQGSLDIDQGFILMLRDITKQKNLDEERDEFISVVSHELRTPLTITEGTLSNIEAMYERGIDSPSRIRPALKAAHDQVIFLSKMVNDLSTLSRAERGVADSLELVNVDELLSGMYSEYSKQAQDEGLRFNLDIKQRLGNVRVSPLYFSELLQNLLTNAIKYTKEGSVTLAATRVKNTITISVIDTGIGISKSDRDKIFAKFYRSEDYRTRETRGTGLGLYVAMKLARKIGTTIELKSRLNHGSTFSISLEASDER